MKATGIDKIKNIICSSLYRTDNRKYKRIGFSHIKTEDIMTENSISTSHDHKKARTMNYTGISGGIYGMAFLGSLVYYIQHATSIWCGVLGVFKAIFWPAVLMYKVLELLRM